MKRCIVLALAIALLFNLCSLAHAAGEVCIGPDGGISLEHSYLQGVCTACGYVVEDCAHANIVPAGEAYEKVEKLGTDFHAEISFHSDACDFCLDCRSTLVDGTAQQLPADQYSYLIETVGHTMENNVCVECGYIHVLCFKKY